MPYYHRIVERQLHDHLREHAAVLIEGARGVGKTTTASQVAATVFELQNEATLERLTEDPDIILRSPTPVLVDEWPSHPRVMNTIKLAVDKDSAPGQFILTGSPSKELPEDVHTGIGRVVPMTMRPMSLAERPDFEPTVSLADLLSGGGAEIGGSSEVTKFDYATALMRSGFPQCYERPERYARDFVGAYLRQLVSLDMRSGNRNISTAAITRWLSSYAEAVSTETDFEKIRKRVHRQDESSTVAESTVIRYRNSLESLAIIEPLQGWHPPLSPISKTKKTALHHLVDPALAAHLMGFREPDNLLDTELAPDSRHAPGKKIFGLLFQSLVTQSVRVYAQAHGADVYWMGTQKSKSKVPREVDIVVRTPAGHIVAIEVKSASTVAYNDVAHLLWLRDQLGYQWADGVVVNTGSEAYRRDDGIAVVPAALLGP